MSISRNPLFTKDTKKLSVYKIPSICHLWKTWKDIFTIADLSRTSIKGLETLKKIVHLCVLFKGFLLSKDIK